MLRETPKLLPLRYRRTALVARMMTVCEMPGRVYSCLSAAAVAKQELTPGITRTAQSGFAASTVSSSP